MLYVNFRIGSEYRKALDWFQGNSEFYVDDWNDKDNWLAFECDSSEADVLEESLNKDLLNQKIEHFEFEYIG